VKIAVVIMNHNLKEIKMKKSSLRKSIALALGVTAMIGVSTQASAGIGAYTGMPTFTGSTVSYSAATAYKSWSDYGTASNFAWGHTVSWNVIQIGSDTDIENETTFDVNFDLSNESYRSGFSVWTSGAAPTTTSLGEGVGAHTINQVRGANDGSTYNFALSGSYGNIVDGHDGWVGYAQNGFDFTNGDGDFIANGGAANMTSGVVSGYSADASISASLTLLDLAAGYYLVAAGGVCPDNLGAACAMPGSTASSPTDFTFTVSAVSAVPVPAAVWLFGSAIAGLGFSSRRKLSAQ